MGTKAGAWLRQAESKGLLKKGNSVNSSATAAASGSLLTSVPATLLASFSEKEWQQLVVGYATTRGWKVAHCRKVLVKNGKKQHWETTMPAGWFDLYLVRGGIYHVELKVHPNTLEPEQEEWAAAVRDAGGAVRLWYPEHWPEVQETLR